MLEKNTMMEEMIENYVKQLAEETDAVKSKDMPRLFSNDRTYGNRRAAKSDAGKVLAWSKTVELGNTNASSEPETLDKVMLTGTVFEKPKPGSLT